MHILGLPLLPDLAIVICRSAPYGKGGSLRKQGDAVEQELRKMPFSQVERIGEVFSFNPQLKAEGKNPFTLTSKPGDGSYQDFLNNETRYSRLTRAFPERAERLFKASEEAAKARYEHLQRLVELYK